MKKQRDLWNLIFALASLVISAGLVYTLFNLETSGFGSLHPRVILEIIFFLLFVIIVLGSNLSKIQS